jgi:hypothetical protein
VPEWQVPKGARETRLETTSLPLETMESELKQSAESIEGLLESREAPFLHSNFAPFCWQSNRMVCERAGVCFWTHWREARKWQIRPMGVTPIGPLKQWRIAVRSAP